MPGNNKNKKVALITGITGQDGSYMADLLLSKGYEVHGLVRRNSRIDRDAVPYIVHYGDMSDGGCLYRILESAKPDEIYNFAAQSHVGLSFETAEYTMDINSTGVSRLLAAIHSECRKTRLYQASSSELFGNSPPPQNEDAPFNPQSPYACAKLSAHYQVIGARQAYGLWGCCGIAHNHESPRRGNNFVTQKIAKAVARIKAGIQDKLLLGSMAASRDWGWAPDYVEAMWLMLQAE